MVCYGHISHLRGERDRGEIESVRAKINISNMLPVCCEPIDAIRQLGEKVASTLVRGRGVDC